jgi:hypothetical protein
MTTFESNVAVAVFCGFQSTMVLHVGGEVSIVDAFQTIDNSRAGE